MKRIHRARPKVVDTRPSRPVILYAMSCEEIAAMFGVHKRSVQKVLEKAEAKLREALAEEYA